jgi:hypothetical protein
MLGIMYFCKRKVVNVLDFLERKKIRITSFKCLSVASFLMSLCYLFLAANGNKVVVNIIVAIVWLIAAVLFLHTAKTIKDTPGA